MVPITPECSWEITERPCRKELTANGKAWSRDSSNPFKKKQGKEGEGGRQLVSGEEGDAGGAGGRGDRVKGDGAGLEYKLYALKKKLDSSLALEFTGDL